MTIQARLLEAEVDLLSRIVGRQLVDVFVPESPWHSRTSGSAMIATQLVLQMDCGKTVSIWNVDCSDPKLHFDGFAIRLSTNIALVEFDSSKWISVVKQLKLKLPQLIANTQLITTPLNGTSGSDNCIDEGVRIDFQNHKPLFIQSSIGFPNWLAITIEEDGASHF